MSSILNAFFWWVGFSVCIGIVVHELLRVANVAWCASMLTWMHLRRADKTIRGLQRLRLIAILWRAEASSLLFDSWPAVSWSINGYELVNGFRLPHKIRSQT